MKTIKNEIRYIISPQCNGSGKEEERKNLYESENVICTYCKGKRVVLEQETITHKSIN